MSVIGKLHRTMARECDKVGKLQYRFNSKLYRNKECDPHTSDLARIRNGLGCLVLESRLFKFFRNHSIPNCRVAIHLLHMNFPVLAPGTNLSFHALLFPLNAEDHLSTIELQNAKLAVSIFNKISSRSQISGICSVTWSDEKMKYLFHHHCINPRSALQWSLLFPGLS